MDNSDSTSQLSTLGYSKSSINNSFNIYQRIEGYGQDDHSPRDHIKAANTELHEPVHGLTFLRSFFIICHAS